MLKWFKRKDQTPPPPWSGYENMEDFQVFITHVKNYFLQNNIRTRMEEGVVVLLDNGFGFEKFGLQNLSQICAANPKQNCAQIIKNHFDNIREGEKFTREFEEIKKDFTKVKDYICVRIVHEEYAKAVGDENVFYKQVCGDIYSMLVYDLPTTIASIKPSEAELWPINDEELWALAIANSQDHYPLAPKMESMGELKIFVLENEHFFGPNIILNLEEWKEKLCGKYGCIFSTPTRHLVVIYPVNDLEVIQAINAMIPSSYNINRQGPGSISNNLIYYNNGIYEHLKYEIEDGKISFYPSNGFIKVMEEIGKTQDT